MLIGHGKSFFVHGKVMEKSWKIIVEKEWSPWDMVVLLGDLVLGHEVTQALAGGCRANNVR